MALHGRVAVRTIDGLESRALSLNVVHTAFTKKCGNLLEEKVVNLRETFLALSSTQKTLVFCGLGLVSGAITIGGLMVVSQANRILLLLTFLFWPSFCLSTFVYYPLVRLSNGRGGIVVDGAIATIVAPFLVMTITGPLFLLTSPGMIVLSGESPLIDAVFASIIMVEVGLGVFVAFWRIGMSLLTPESPRNRTARIWLAGLNAAVSAAAVASYCYSNIWLGSFATQSTMKIVVLTAVVLISIATSACLSLRDWPTAENTATDS